MKKEWLQEMKRFCEEESGVGVVEIILVLVVIVGLILIFKKQLTSLVNKAFSNINDKERKCYRIFRIIAGTSCICAVCISGSCAGKLSESRGPFVHRSGC